MQDNLGAKHVHAISGLGDAAAARGAAPHFCAMLTHVWNEAVNMPVKDQVVVRGAVCRALGRRKDLPESTLKFVRKHVVRSRLPLEAACLCFDMRRSFRAALCLWLFWLQHGAIQQLVWYPDGRIRWTLLHRRKEFAEPAESGHVQMPVCLKWIDWETAPTFAYAVRSFALQDKAILKDLLTDPFLPALCAAASSGSAVAADVLLDLAVAHSRVARRAAEAGVLTATPALLAAASGAAGGRAAAAVVAIAHGATAGKRTVVASVRGWATDAAAEIAARAPDAASRGAAMAALLAALADSSDSIRRAVAGSPAAAALAVAAATAAEPAEPAAAAAAVAALPRVGGTAADVARLCERGRFAALIRGMRASEAVAMRAALEAAGAIAAMPLPAPLAAAPPAVPLLLRGGMQPAAVHAAATVLTAWAAADSAAGALHGVPPEQRQASIAAQDSFRQLSLAVPATPRPGAGDEAAALRAEQVRCTCKSCAMPIAYTRCSLLPGAPSSSLQRGPRTTSRFGHPAPPCSTGQGLNWSTLSLPSAR